MRRSPITRIAGCLVAAIALLFIVPGTSMAAEKGLSVDLTWGIKSADQDRTASLLPDTGAKWVRLTFEWNQLETSQGTYNSSKLAAWDRSVSLSRQAGTKVLVTVYGTPSWASSNGKVGGAPSNNAYYANLMSFLANRYRGQVQAWEIWNEENVSRFWTSGPDPARYAGLLRAAYPAVKSADPNATVVFGGTSGNDTGFVDGAYRAGAKDNFDVMAVHPYTGSAPEAGGGLYSFPGYREVRDVMLRYGDAKPMWLTEFGWSTTSDNWGVSDAGSGRLSPARLSHARAGPLCAGCHLVQLSQQLVGQGCRRLGVPVRPDAHGLHSQALLRGVQVLCARRVLPPPRPAPAAPRPIRRPAPAGAQRPDGHAHQPARDPPASARRAGGTTELLDRVGLGNRQRRQERSGVDQDRARTPSRASASCPSPGRA